MSETGAFKMTWMLRSMFCIACGVPLGIRLTEIKNQEYFYCSNCHKKEHIGKGIDVEKIYNERLMPLEKQK